MNQDPLVVAPSDGVARGDDSAIPNRGTTSGFVNQGEPYGADVAVDATNRMGGIHAQCGSDAPDLCHPKGDVDRFSSSGHGSPDDGGRSMGSATQSDPADDTSPGDAPDV